jgi:hypothetical protein
MALMICSSLSEYAGIRVRIHCDFTMRRGQMKLRIRRYSKPNIAIKTDKQSLALMKRIKVKTNVPVSAKIAARAHAMFIARIMPKNALLCDRICFGASVLAASCGFDMEGHSSSLSQCSPSPCVDPDEVEDLPNPSL